MGPYVLECMCMGALSSSRPPYKVVRSSVLNGEPAKLCLDEPVTTSSARFISTSDADKPPQKCGKVQRTGDFRLSPPANLANSAILPTAKISTFSCKISSPESQKTPACQCPHRGYDRQRARRASPECRAFRPKDNITRRYVTKP